jgi:hypothetical protein
LNKLKHRNNYRNLSNSSKNPEKVSPRGFFNT